MTPTSVPLADLDITIKVIASYEGVATMVSRLDSVPGECLEYRVSR